MVLNTVSIREDVEKGMYNSRQAKAAEKTLLRMGFVYCGGDEWVHESGIAPEDIPKRFKLIGNISAQVDLLRGCLSNIEDDIEVETGEKIFEILNDIEEALE